MHDFTPDLSFFYKRKPFNFGRLTRIITIALAGFFHQFSSLYMDVSLLRRQDYGMGCHMAS